MPRSAALPFALVAVAFLGCGGAGTVARHDPAVAPGDGTQHLLASAKLEDASHGFAILSGPARGSDTPPKTGAEAVANGNAAHLAPVFIPLSSARRGRVAGAPGMWVLGRSQSICLLVARPSLDHKVPSAYSLECVSTKLAREGELMLVAADEHGNALIQGVLPNGAYDARITTISEKETRLIPRNNLYALHVRLPRDLVFQVGDRTYSAHVPTAPNAAGSPFAG